MTDWDRLVEKFINREYGHSFRCKYHYDAHWQDEVIDGCWYLHGKLVAEYDSPSLWLSDAGYPTITTRSRLVMALTGWRKRHKVERFRFDLSRFGTDYILLAITPREEDGRTRFYIARGITLTPTPEGDIIVSSNGKPAREVIPRKYNPFLEEFYIPRLERIYIPRFGVIGAVDGKIFLLKEGTRWEPYYEVTLEELQEKLREAMPKLGRKGRTAAFLFLYAGDEREIETLIRLAKHP